MQMMQSNLIKCHLAIVVQERSGGAKFRATSLQPLPTSSDESYIVRLRRSYMLWRPYFFEFIVQRIAAECSRD
jgi:hypothetical protein